MDIDIGLLGALCREGMTSFYDYHIGPNMIGDHVRFVFTFIEDYWKEYKKVPQAETIRQQTGIDVLTGPMEPLDFWCKKIRERNLYEGIRNGLVEVAEAMENVDSVKAFTYMQALVYKLSQDVRTSDRPTPLFGKPQEIWEDYVRAKKGTTGVPTPWPSMNEITKGWQGADFALLAARPGSGKTWLLLILAVWAWKNNYKILLGSTEMSHKSLRRRAAALICKLSYSAIRDGALNSTDEELFKEQIFKLSEDDKFLILGDGFDVTLNSIEAAVIEHEPHLVCIDGIYLLKTTGKFDKKNDNIAEIFNQTKSLAKRRNIPIIASTQMNRPPRGGAVASGGDLSRLAFTDAAAQITDYVFYLTQTSDQKSARELEIEPAKLREADFLRNIKINWKFDTQDFSEILAEGKTVDVPVKKQLERGPAGFKVHDVPEDDPW